MVSKVLSSSYIGIESYILEVEADIMAGLPSFNIVGLADVAISESKERVRAAIKNSGYEVPARRIVINLSPAGIRKEGASFDLPIAIGILASLGEVENKKLKKYIVLGELSLNGDIRKIDGAINSVICAKENEIFGVILPRENYLEASVIKGVEIIPVDNLVQVVQFLNDKIEIESPKAEEKKEGEDYSVDFKEVKGQVQAKRCIEIAAAGGHNFYMIGTPGAGKSMLAKRLPTILPPMSEGEIIESTKIYSSTGLLTKDIPIIDKRPFRSPHHSSSMVSIVGGGRVPKAGEVSLAHNGVLFLDEVTEFPRMVLETLRQPLEDKKVSITRAEYRVEMPADMVLIMASNPCPCGNLFENRCSCSLSQINRYQHKISGPLLDRIDLYLEIKKLSRSELASYEEGERSVKIRERVEKARKIQWERFGSSKINGNMTPKEIKKYCKLDDKSKKVLIDSIDIFGLSGRSYDKVLKVGRTIADLEGSKNIELSHIMEALSYRKK
ncbi:MULTISPECIES: YifB family Mg chelatase-like AAA ATPase [Psychrilyobacter]|uniref:ATP-binding protein n=1 Tax=Psychrilyobacter piezotolerans TaxID=2293438 RepID=A0ABX9KKR3_9FUSO|nr:MULTISPECIES: YifB family Mg chelatase-like AAA ATPase [Psychrilyobacter]MCS5420372.1 YifB family Mg chelatase-like AAA ATPase [Psychrilyobacter sp. S5]NDI76375.1 YifB family Mg chelatase-like AAA ATPase [Psychrilyobacter piezotolerans]RDE65973.1 ATP-binding protein [Psychrilyobacter sp. S5]REI43151.1 ATP-binding protein [Psychrilyobacter piezotolerans]